MKLFTAITAVALIAAPAQAATEADYQNCLKLKAEVNAYQAGLGDKSYDCEGLRTWKSPKQRITAAGGRTKLIRKCEAIWKPQLKDEGSYSYKGANITIASNKLNVKVNYTAKNSFGARVPGIFTCGFGG